MFKKIQNAFNRIGQNPIENQSEYIQYAQEVECTLRLLESQLHEMQTSRKK